ncbi:hypothetical protein U8335_20565 [Roseiconus lacunae]|uniref:hypothetical protein n=1 Tax=Roseiconus lacunae TaxID=2605694 RepID=UPI00308480F6|nr:hypothetical protein U8335_20565 [Stieleria sp. HD01]
MSQSRKRVAKRDLNHAKDYLQRRLRDYALSLAPEHSIDEARLEFERIIWGFDSKDRSLLFHSWCEKYLIAIEWEKLEEAVCDGKRQVRRFREFRTALLSQAT